MTKSELRELYKSKRKELSSQDIDDLSLAIFENLKSLPIWDHNVYHLFLSIKSLYEVNTDPILQHLFYLQKKTIVPKIVNQKMIGVEIKKGFEVEIGKFNVPEPKSSDKFDPKEIEVMFLPLLICDQKGNRVGYGAGYYDRFLEQCDENLLKIGINFYNPIETIKDINQHDVPLDYCVTSDGVFSFSGDLLMSEK